MPNRTSLALLGIVALTALVWGARSRYRQGWMVRLHSHEPTLFAFELGGYVGQDEIRAMARTVLSAFKRFDEIDMLVVLPAFTGLTPAAALDLKGMKAGLFSLGKVRRYAVVAPPGWADVMINIGDKVIPVESRTFPLSALYEAKEWVKSGR